MDFKWYRGNKLILYSTFTYLVDAFADPESAFVGHQCQPWYNESLTAVKAWWAGELQTDEEVTEACSKAIKFYFKAIDDKAEQYFQRIHHLTLRLAPLATFWQTEATDLSYLPELKNISVPTQVLVGRHDFVAPISMSADIAQRIPGAKLSIFEASGHFAHVEEPKRFHRVIKQFVFDNG
ncbi:alpha/beta fold hydrolase [Marinobacterium rhizophilum]|uniref:Alpha/beta hydrolase n=1 Tax=Marinobacterium rhizophilum TaxID=420402 RepID=A0ABY5HNY8_9GAMM|nr:alpha/beta hydrolase [Marinobacterium rhizophilum]UTW12905.1 alpha/beta hydrolase [Marinobacterium rhizophilum]